MTNSNFYTALEQTFAANASRRALELASSETCTYADLDREVARCAAALADLGLKRGDRVAVQIEKSPQSMFLYLACLRAGLVYLPLNTAYRLAELSHFLADAEPALVVCAPSNEAGMQKLAKDTGLRAMVLTLDDAGRGSLADAVAGARAEFSTAIVEPDELAVIVYTSGTTGRSKGAMLSHRNLSSNARALVDYWRFTHDDVLLHTLPIFHVHGLFVANHCGLLSGARMLWR
ncbi:MAG TPA: AMP-binding protein, partial [Burkholderiales bacterium]|nr:AMP-binding protein [Burkholderiales bacterium]